MHRCAGTCCYRFAFLSSNYRCPHGTCVMRLSAAYHMTLLGSLRGLSSCCGLQSGNRRNVALLGVGKTASSTREGATCDPLHAQIDSNMPNATIQWRGDVGYFGIMLIMHAPSVKPNHGVGLANPSCRCEKCYDVGELPTVVASYY
jgi:hypothetical protein